MANYFFCSLVEGKTPADLLAFKAEYEKSVPPRPGSTGYELRVQFPLFFNDVRNGRFIWDGSWTDIDGDGPDYGLVRGIRVAGPVPEDDDL